MLFAVDGDVIDCAVINIVVTHVTCSNFVCAQKIKLIFLHSLWFS
jgi:hypothetical protein